MFSTSSDPRGTAHSESPDPLAKPEQKGSWTVFLKNLSTFSGDLSALTAPSFILSPTSLAEFPSYWGEPSAEFDAIGRGVTDEERFRRLVAWFILTLKPQFTTREAQSGSEKKPLNPILGEVFIGNWPAPADGSRGEIKLLAEQVSHHPPITAYHIEDKAAGVIMEGHCAQKTSFSGKSIIVKQVGHALIKLPAYNENYLITLPKLRLEGLWYASPYVELCETSYIQSSTGYKCEISYSGKGYLTGKAHSFKAVTTKNGVPIWNAEGQWVGESRFGKGGMLEGQLFTDTEISTREVITVKPVEEQGPMESRRVWRQVADGIRSSDFEKASKEKSRIENEQRNMRKEEIANGTTWKLQFFEKVEDDEIYSGLADMFGFTPAKEESYRFVEA